MNTNGMIHALSKFYTAGFEFLAFNVGNNTDTAIALSNFFEVQDSGTLVLNITTQAGQTPDFSFLDTIKENRSTKVVSLPSDKDPDNVLATSTLGKYGGRAEGANFKFIQDLPGVTPQDEFNFTPNDLKVYEKYNIATYAIENGTAMTTNGRSLTGFDVGALVVRDSIRKAMINEISSFLMNNDVVSYNDASINTIRGMEQGILTRYKNNNLIADYEMNPNSTKITDEVKATGIYKDAGYKYKPMRSIDQVKVSQTLNITKEE
ncbi:hypothetical protein [Apilactobacillus micheneri]|uniref:hypothetical protein n=1 Tax=Apilactobacillus micheneri TaxID=1899430 RepID=UPI000D02B664|nr:hypothetical protein [Apilactobacillus micheneri]